MSGNGVKTGKWKWQAIVRLITGAPLLGGNNGAKVLSYDAIKEAGLYPTIEVGNRGWCDIRYIQHVANHLRYSTVVGSALHLYPMHSTPKRGRNYKHGQSTSKLYCAWRSMNDRCYNPKQNQYKNYGERGIRVCERWQSSFEAFRDDMGPKPTPQHTLERIDNNGNYEPTNCRWATVKEQGRNRRTTRFITIGSETRCLSEWIERSGLKRKLVEGRLRAGWTIEEALNTPALKPHGRRRLHEVREVE